MASIRRNAGYAGDPYIAKAVENLAGLFAPPSGADAAGWANANAKRAEAARIAELYAGAAGDTDRQSVIAGLYAPTQSYKALGINDATTRRGQDLTAATARENNIRDNARAVATTRYGAISEGQILPELPASVAALYGLPAAQPQTGVVKLSQNQTAILPTGETLTGINRAQTLDEWQAAQAERQRQAGTLTDAAITDLIMGKQSPVVAMVGGKPVYVAPGTAARMQMPAAAAPSSADNKLVEGTAIVAGRPTQVFRPPSSPDYSTADGASLPLGTQVFEKATPQATQGDLKGTEFSDRNAIFYNRAAPASAAMSDLVKQGYVPSARDFELMLGKTGELMPLSLSNSLVSDQGRQFYNNAMNFMLSVLRPDTGAAFGREEFANYAKVFVPLPGDDAQTLANKVNARETALAALQGTSRGAADRITQLMQSQGLPIPPEMAKRLQAVQAGQQAAAPGRSMAGPAGGDQPGTLADARDAIQRGASREAVIQRLRSMGIDPGGL